MQYWVDGEETSPLTEWWWRNFSTNKGKGMLAFVLICIVLLCGTCGFGIRYYIRSQINSNRVTDMSSTKSKEVVEIKFKG